MRTSGEPEEGTTWYCRRFTMPLQARVAVFIVRRVRVEMTESCLLNPKRKGFRDRLHGRLLERKSRQTTNTHHSYWPRQPRPPRTTPPPPPYYYYITVRAEGGSTSRHEGVRAENVTLHLVSWSRSSVQYARPSNQERVAILSSKSSISSTDRKYGCTVSDSLRNFGVISNRSYGFI